MKKKILPGILFTALLLTFTTGDAQVIMRKKLPARYSQQRNRIRERRPKFEPTVNLSIGYGFPNLDKDFFPAYYDAYRGNTTQKGPITVNLDYQFSRRMSIGLMVTNGTVTAPYYDYYSSPDIPLFYTKYKNWSVMVNLMKYIPAGKKVTPYLRTAIGVHLWYQEYTDANHNRINMYDAGLPNLAYQAGIGAKLNLSKKAGVFVEAGYGKYILHGGLAFKF